MRLFVAITPGPETLSRIAAATARLRPHAPTAKWVKPDGCHLTLAFLGERDSGDAPKIALALEEAARELPRFRLHFRGAGTFGRPARPKVLWVGCEGDVAALRALFHRVNGALSPFGYAPDRPELTPHCTLCRARDAGGDRALARCAELLKGEDFGEAWIESVDLYESRLSPAGAVYTVIARAALGQGTGPTGSAEPLRQPSRV